MSYFAHTPSSDGCIEPHTYTAHIQEMLDYGLPLFSHVLGFSRFTSVEREDLTKTFKAALMLHDMGKLDGLNQEILGGSGGAALPIDHIEAGVKVAEELNNPLLAWLIRGHHKPGLPSLQDEKAFSRAMRDYFIFGKTALRGKRIGRDKLADETICIHHQKAIEHTEANFSLYKQRQVECCGKWPDISISLPSEALTFRLMLSCLVTADHLSAAAYSEQITMPEFKPINCRWEQRLLALNNHVEKLASKSNKECDFRQQLRQEFYLSCLEGALYESPLLQCSAPVGLGKTTSVSAYLMRIAQKKGCSRIFVIAPFSNIVDQTTKTLREAVVLEGEDPNEIVVAHHHKVEFSDHKMRQYAASWQAPLVVTTAVQFFETLASALPTQLKKLNAVAGAAIFIDESHACLPPELLKVAWHWLYLLANQWQCTVVFSSGSMVEFWNDTYLTGQKHVLPDIFPAPMWQKANTAERKRIQFSQIEYPLSLSELIDVIESENVWQGIDSQPLPCALIILNTVQSAAVVAQALAKKFNNSSSTDTELAQRRVLHLSTALAPADRAKIIDEITRRQTLGNWRDGKWYLVATSCVEAGIDLDFSVGFRERCSITSFLQVAGRINRHGLRETGVLYDFTVKEQDNLVLHPGFKAAIAVFNRLWPEVLAGEKPLTELSTAAVRLEYSMVLENQCLGNTENSFAQQLLQDEIKLNFQQVNDNFKIIKTDTVTVLTSLELAQKLELGLPAQWQEIQQHSVQLWCSKVKKLGLTVINNCRHDEIYNWQASYEYDPHFLGIMAGILTPQQFFTENAGIL